MLNDVNRCRNPRVCVLHGFSCWIIGCKHWRQPVANSWDKELCRAVEGLSDLRWRRGEGISKSPNLGMTPEWNLQELCTCKGNCFTRSNSTLLVVWVLQIAPHCFRYVQITSVHFSIQFQPFWPSVYDRHRLSSACHRVFSHFHHHVSPLIEVLRRLSLGGSLCSWLMLSTTHCCSTTGETWRKFWPQEFCFEWYNSWMLSFAQCRKLNYCDCVLAANRTWYKDTMIPCWARCSTTGVLLQLIQQTCSNSA